MVGMFLYLGGVVGCPHVCAPPCMFVHPHMFIHPHTFVCPQGCTHPPWAPMLSVLLHGFGALYVVGGCFLLNVYWGTPPLFGGASPYPPTLLCFRDISSYVGAFPLLLKGLGCFPHHLGRFGGTSALCCSHVHSYTFFVVNYVSHLDHGSDYYSSS